MVKMKKMCYLTMIFVAVGINCFAQKHELVSGMPLKTGMEGLLPLPALTGTLMGTASLNNEANPTLFLQATGYNSGIFLHSFKGFTAKGEPLFSAQKEINVSADVKDKRGVVFQSRNKAVYGLWRSSKAVSIAEFNQETLTFGKLRTISVTGLPRAYSTLGLIEMNNGQFQFLFTVANRDVHEDEKKKPDVRYFTEEGFWQYPLQTVGIFAASTTHLTELKMLNASPLTGLDQAYFGINGYTGYDQPEGMAIIAGTRLGDIHVWGMTTDSKVREKKYVVDKKGNLMRHPVMNTYVSYFKTANQTEGLITSGEGGLYFFKNTKRKDPKGNLVFDDPVGLFQEKNANLYAGSLVVPDLVDWDGDGLIDIITGNSEGKILFFKNKGTNTLPIYHPPVALKAGDEDIYIQPGYREDIQGPMEARWGYTCPTVIDWNSDGLLDILTGDSRGKFMVFLNKGTKSNPILEAERSLYLDGMNLYGGWRSKPGVAKLGDNMAYVITDRDNEFHLYWQLDQYNVSDGGKLKIGDTVAIKAHRRKGGQVGRAKIHIVDWDGDGVKDMLVGTGRGAAIPNPINGLPYNREVKNEGAAVLFLRNSGSDTKPVFEFPKMMKFKGKDILLGAHEAAPTTTTVGSNGKVLNLVVGTENGTFIYYDRKDLSW